MAKQTRLHKTFSALRSGKVVKREDLAKAIGLSNSATQTHIKWLETHGVRVNVVRDGRTDQTYQLVDIEKLKVACDNGGRLTGAKVSVPKAVAVKAPAGKQLSAKQAGKATKHVPKAVKQKIAQNHLDDAPGVFDDRPASERKGKASILDKDLDIAHVTEREFNDIKSMLGIDL
jgi:predicted ArsR family transcriptional regulator